MTAKSALIAELLKGSTINIKNCFTLIGYTNAPRELSRLIEKPFNVKLQRKQKEGKSRYYQPVWWFDYKLPFTEENMEGIMKMREYLKKDLSKTKPKTDNEAKMLKQLEMFTKPE